jgi:hypothetical protein
MISSHKCLVNIKQTCHIIIITSKNVYHEKLNVPRIANAFSLCPLDSSTSIYHTSYRTNVTSDFYQLSVLKINAKVNLIIILNTTS